MTRNERESGNATAFKRVERSVKPFVVEEEVLKICRAPIKKGSMPAASFMFEERGNEDDAKRTVEKMGFAGVNREGKEISGGAEE